MLLLKNYLQLSLFLSSFKFTEYQYNRLRFYDLEIISPVTLHVSTEIARIQRVFV